MARLHKGKVVTYEEFTDSLYGHREDGGPLDPHNVIAVAVCGIRKKLQGSPWKIIKPGWYSYRLVDRLGKTIDTISDKIIVDANSSPPED